MNSGAREESGLFVGHRTYAPRESWFYKGMSAVVEQAGSTRKRNPFLLPDAAEQFGIGSSMVAAARFWVQATGLMTEQGEGKQHIPVLTPFGRLVWAHDRYMEDPATLYWMHYHVICNKALAPTWYWLYNHGPALFTMSECVPLLWRWAVSRFAEQEIREDALQRDIACLLRMYVPRVQATPENLTISPFSRLRMITLQEGKADEPYYQRVPSQNLHGLVLLALLVDQQNRNGERQLALLDALHEPMSVGRCFHLSGPLLLDVLVQLPKWHPSWQVQIVHAPDGRDLFSLPTVTFLDVVQSYYCHK